MFTVDLRLTPDDLAGQMSEMRVWLDGHHVETSGFFYESGSDCAMACLTFKVRGEAEAFAGQFAGTVIPDVVRRRPSRRSRPAQLATADPGRVLAA